MIVSIAVEKILWSISACTTVAYRCNSAKFLFLKSLKSKTHEIDYKQK